MYVSKSVGCYKNAVICGGATSVLQYSPSVGLAQVTRDPVQGCLYLEETSEPWSKLPL